MKKLLRRIELWMYRRLSSKYKVAQPVTVVADGSLPINIAPGDTCEVRWAYKLEFDAERNVVSIYGYESGEWEYKGDVSHKEVYESHLHTVDIDYSKETEIYRITE